MKTINSILLEWYQGNKRDLPWRENTNAYRIWVSEIMLQQTRVEAVKPYFYRFMETLPTLRDLASCEEDKLIKLWEGLGYYSRVRNMKKAAVLCCEKYNGDLPDNYEALLTLPGIGPYTAAAISSIAYNENQVAIDGNILRVFSRLLEIKEEITSKSAHNAIKKYFEENHVANMGDLNQAIMDFGNAICLPNAALRCNICPLQYLCKGYQNHTAINLPLKKKKKKRRVENLTVLVYVYKQEVLIHKRSETGLLASLYEFVNVEGLKTKKDYPQAIYLGKHKHLFSHVEWNLKGFLIETEKKFEKDNYLWVKISELENIYSIPKAYAPYRKKLLEIYE